MIYIGLDDTDIEGSPGTNQLALTLAEQLADRYEVVQIVRHQLLFDPRVPYTSQNGSASMAIRRKGVGDRGEGIGVEIAALSEELSTRIVRWCPAGSDPGLCITADVPQSIVEFGQHCQRDLVKQPEAREAAAAAGLLLLGLGGTQDGVIGALAAVGLCAAGNDGRVIYLGAAETDISEVGGPQPLAQLARYGIDDVIEHDTGRAVTSGIVHVGKKLRPNIRGGKTVLYVRPAEEQATEKAAHETLWQAVKVK
ncbi:MAG: ABC transporter substrate-binding protein [Planctomycetes bacterium]|nr:ABC transporter substrate-binding protein [Planctomycetota bacterium]